MGPVDLYFDFRDLFKALRLALSGKKIWIFISGSIKGYIVYWIFSYVSIVLSGETFAAIARRSDEYLVGPRFSLRLR